jgi:hypothetical protein
MEQWVARINEAWRSSVEGILAVGRLLIDAKEGPEKLPHGEFGKMIESRLPFQARTAQMLMAIAEDKRIANTKHVSHLPSSWGTLYELTKVPDEVFEKSLKEGVIRPDMPRDEAMRLHRPFGNARHEIRQETAAEREAFRQGRFDPDTMWSAMLDSLIARRKSLGWPQKELDEKTGWADGQCDKYERGDRHPCKGLMEWLCALNYNIVMIPRELQPGNAVAPHRQTAST